MIIVLSEASSHLEPTPSARELQAATEAAKLTGCRVYYIPQSFDDLAHPSDAFAHIPVQESDVLGVWNGYIPTPEHYETVYQLALEKRIHLLNTPAEHLRAQEFDRAYERLEGLTPKSIIVTDPGQCDEAVQILGLPVFIKGAVQSRKARGWKACVAQTLEEVRLLTSQYLSLEGRTRGRVVIRELAPIRHVNKTVLGFPIGREYRVFLHRSDVLGYGYYWDGEDPLATLSASEKPAVLSLAVEAARRLDVPFVSIDIGQLDDGKWIVIESGDAQFSSVSRIPLLPLWNQINRIES